MLAVARARWPAVRFSLGTAEALPASDEWFDVVFSIDVIHHVADRARSLAEAFRVLGAGGRLCVGTEDEAMIRARFHSRYFPETVDVELARYPAIGELVGLLTASGFTRVREERIESSRFIGDSRPYRDKAFSPLHLIPEAAHRRGLARLVCDLADGPMVAPVRQLLLWAEKP
jgi:SAM-dependent methyltransferase